VVFNNAAGMAVLRAISDSLILQIKSDCKRFFGKNLLQQLSQLGGFTWKASPLMRGLDLPFFSQLVELLRSQHPSVAIKSQFERVARATGHVRSGT